MPELIARWGADVAVLAPPPDPEADPDAVMALGADLLLRWQQPQRRYHTTQHLSEMFSALDELELAREIEPRSAAVGRVAAWFHDAVYAVDAGAADNEARSAALARATLPSLGVAADDLAVVEALVRASERHALPTAGGLDAAFHDADLWILSAPSERFDEYCAQVRQEYALVSDAAYAVGRAAVLSPLVERGRLYATELGHARWQAAARANLRRELGRLRR